MSGDDVAKWQTFLRGYRPDSVVAANGNFDDVTHLETKRFQVALGLDSDGVVGSMTLAAALRTGFHILADDDAAEDGPNWPAKPAFSSLLGPAREKLFGKFAYVPAPTEWSAEAIRITDMWPANNIISVEVPQLVGVTGAPRDGKVQFHKLAAKQLAELFAAWEAAGLKDRLLAWSGSWAPRFIRGSRTYLSNHAWGTAFDINVPWNALGAKPALKGQKGSVRELVAIANDHGFFWGGHWDDRPDGMHFEVAELR